MSSMKPPSSTEWKGHSDVKSKDFSKDKQSTKESSKNGRSKDKRKRHSSSCGSCTRSPPALPAALAPAVALALLPWVLGKSNTSSNSSSSPSISLDVKVTQKHFTSPKGRKRWNLSSNHTKVPAGRLTRSVMKDHITGVFSTYRKMIGIGVENDAPPSMQQL